MTESAKCPWCGKQLTWVIVVKRVDPGLTCETMDTCPACHNGIAWDRPETWDGKAKPFCHWLGKWSEAAGTWVK